MHKSKDYVYKCLIRSRAHHFDKPASLMFDPLIPFITCIKMANNPTGVLASGWNCSAGSFLELCCIYLFAQKTVALLRCN